MENRPSSHPISVSGYDSSRHRLASATPTVVPVDHKRLISPKAAAALAYVAALFMTAMDTHIVNVMLPHLSKVFHSPLVSVEWTAIGYLLSLAVVIPASGWIGDRVGNKKMFLISLALFTVASAACGQAHSLAELVVCRVAQGAGGGMLTPVGTAMLYRAYPPAERARMIRILIAPVLIGPVIAQPIGGVLVTKATWRLAFYLNVPIGVFALVVGSIYLVEHREPGLHRLDVKGLVFSALGLSTLLYSISQGPLKGWASPDVIVTGVVGIFSLVAFVILERRESNPLLKLELLTRDRLFRATNAVSFANTCGFSGLLYLGTIFLQEAKGQTALDAGLTTFAVALGVLVASQTIGRIYTFVGPRRMAGIGSLALACMLAAFLLIGTHTGLWTVRFIMFFAGASNSMNTMGIQTSMFSNVSSADTGQASAILNTGRQTATAVGIAILTLVVSSVSGARIDAFHDAFLVAAGFSLLASIASFALIRDSDAANTLLRPERLARESALAID